MAEDQTQTADSSDAAASAEASSQTPEIKTPETQTPAPAESSDQAGAGQAAAAEQAAAAAEPEKPKIDYAVQIEDAGPATKKLFIEVPREHIQTVLEDQYKELRQKATIPGFRPGHAPRKLIEKRFGGDVKNDVCRKLVEESFEQVIEEKKLSVIGQATFEDAQNIKLPDEGPLKYAVTVEVRPEFDLPDLSAMKITRPTIEVTDELSDRAMNNLRKQQGSLLPVEDRGVEPLDHVIADLHAAIDGTELIHILQGQFEARRLIIRGIDVGDLGESLKGVKPGESRQITIKVPDDHPLESARGREVPLDVQVKEIKRIEPVALDADFCQKMGFDSVDQLRSALKEELESKLQRDASTAMRDQVQRFLLENVRLELPQKLTESQTQRVVQRRATELMMRGMPREQIEAIATELRSGASDEAVNEAKLFFILARIAEEQNIEVNEDELNQMIAVAAAQQGARPEKLKQQMAKDGSLMSLYVQARDAKVLDKLMESAQITESAPASAQAESAPADSAAPAAAGE